MEKAAKERGGRGVAARESKAAKGKRERGDDVSQLLVAISVYRANKSSCQ